MIVRVWAETSDGWTMEEMLLPAGKGLYSNASHDMLHDIAKPKDVKKLFIEVPAFSGSFGLPKLTWHHWNGKTLYSVPASTIPESLKLAVLITGE